MTIICYSFPEKYRNPLDIHMKKKIVLGKTEFPSISEIVLGTILFSYVVKNYYSECKVIFGDRRNVNI